MNHALIFIVHATTVFLIVLEALVLWKIAAGKLDLRLLIANEQGHASLSRLQLLIFAFVIAAGFLYLRQRGRFPGGERGCPSAARDSAGRRRHLARHWIARHCHETTRRQAAGDRAR